MKAVRKAHGSRSFFRNTASPKRLLVASCALLAAAALALPATGSARSSFPATGSLYFAKPAAKVVGGTALVPVQSARRQSGGLSSAAVELPPA